MSQRIWKFPLNLEYVQGSDARFAVPMPRGAQIIRLTSQYNDPCLWALVDPDEPYITRHIVVRGTGHDIPEGATYIGSAETMGAAGGSFIWHFFEVGDGA